MAEVGMAIIAWILSIGIVGFVLFCVYGVIECLVQKQWATALIPLFFGLFVFALGLMWFDLVLLGG